MNGYDWGNPSPTNIFLVHYNDRGERVDASGNLDPNARLQMSGATWDAYQDWLNHKALYGTGWQCYRAELEMTGASGASYRAYTNPIWLYFTEGATTGNPSVVEVIDRSGSMYGSKLDAAKTAASLFVGLMGEGDKIGVVSYDSSADVNFALTEITAGSNVQNQAKAAINQLTAGGTTSIGAGVQAADDQLDRFPSDPIRAMIVMTDGQQNTDPDPISVIQSQVDSSIRVFTIGFGDDAEESLLAQMASLRNGQYWKATEVNLSNIDALLYGGVGGAQQVYNSSDTIQAGQQRTNSVGVDPSTTQLTVGVNWGGSNLDLELVAPDGTVITHATPATNPDVQLVEESTYEFYKIQSPVPGTWEMRVLGVDVPQGGEDYNLYAMVDSGITADVSTDKSSYLTGELVKTSLTLEDGQPIIGASAVAYVTPPTGAAYDKAGVVLYEDGGHDDGAANDGVYGGVFRRACWAGQYRIDLAVHGQSHAGFEFDRAPSASIVVTAAADGDSDGMPDLWEDREGTNNSANDASLDLDLDTLPNLQEFFQGTMPGNQDTDGDKSPDGLEIAFGTDPLDPSSFLAPVKVTGASAMPSGVAVQFDQAVDAASINLFGAQGGPSGAADVRLVGNTVGSISGSLVLDADQNQLMSVAKGGLLPADAYTLTLRSATDGFKDKTHAQLLDGEYSGTFPSGDGTPGGDFVYQFTVGAPAPIVVGLPDFAQGPGQSTGSAGLPIHLNNAAGVESVDFTLTYNPDLLNITAVSLGPDVVEGSMVRSDFSVPGQVKVSFFALNPMPAGAADIISLSAVVPAGATYGAAEVLHISDLRINEGLLPATAADAIHVVAYPGDATGNGGDLWTRLLAGQSVNLEDTYSGLDAQKVSRVAARLDSGFAAYPTIDPVIVGDVTGDGTISGLDASYLLEEATGDCAEIPPLPSPPANAQPIATAQGVTTAEEVPLEITLTGDDGDPEVVQTLTFAIATQPAHGTLSGLNPSTGTVTYTPNADFNGTDSFTFTVTDDNQAGPTANLTSAAATVTITITPVNKPPVANAQDVTTPENVAKAITLTEDDSDPLPGETQALTFAITSQPLHGTLTGFNMTTGAVTYTPERGYVGSDSFKFRVIDDNTAGRPYGLMSDEATVSITVTDVNDPPSFTKGSDQAVNEDAGPQTVNGWATNISPGPPNEAGQELDFIVSADTPALFAVQPAIDATSGTLTYTPAGNANGSSVVTIRLHDNGGTADGGQHTSAPQTFTITINPVNDAPVLAAIGSKRTDEQALLSFTVTASDPNDDPPNGLTLSATDLPPGATFDSATGLFSWTPTETQGGASYSVTFQVVDDGTPSLSHSEKITIAVNEVNAAPVLAAIGNKSVDEQTTLTFTASATEPGGSPALGDD